MAKQIIFFDVDGTLINPTSFTIEESTKQALRQLKEEGYILAVATGRSYELTKAVHVDEIVDWDYYVVNNGQRIVDSQGKVLLDEKLDPELVGRFLERAHELDMPVLGQGDRWHFYGEPNDYVREVHHDLKAQDFTPEIYNPNDPIYTLMIYGHDDSIMKDFPELRAIDCPSAYYDVVPTHISKQSAISKVLEFENMSEYLAFGDSLNDLEMILGAKASVATYEAHNTLKENSTFICPEPFNQMKWGIQQLKKEKFL